MRGLIMRERESEGATWRGVISITKKHLKTISLYLAGTSFHSIT